jgi:predicted 3-demethylubiquinone-9 3-methyltransferase (glyoxalase superfamily)
MMQSRSFSPATPRRRSTTSGTDCCGWLKDRYGVSWQITPRRLGALIGGPDKARAAAATQAMLKMVKLDLAALEAAYNG